MISGKVTFRSANGEETFEKGDAYYVPPGHTPMLYAGSEVVEVYARGANHGEDYIRAAEFQARHLLLALGNTPATFYGGLIVIAFGVGLLAWMRYGRSSRACSTC